MDCFVIVPFAIDMLLFILILRSKPFIASSKILARNS